ncbi:hypothetical protein QE432_004229 [Agrobacterium sp. SORGH_AS 745]|uniref:hypothetical protein n=1 Tax=Agrobacterium sp. SORGH_AS_0745 TaxID=3041773 RepID=UPI0027843A95|nr:hypothetical protein [Agrobacterium sp. SORGH_AS_0745]MDQ1222648.1 hypothetical protein [Agrobacterium sp. SORGH_AS_0745]
MIKRSFLFFCGLKLPGIVALATLYAGFLTQALGQSRVCNDPAPVSNLKEMFDAILRMLGAAGRHGGACRDASVHSA